MIMIRRLAFRISIWFNWGEQFLGVSDWTDLTGFYIWFQIEHFWQVSTFGVFPYDHSVFPLTLIVMILLFWVCAIYEMRVSNVMFVERTTQAEQAKQSPTEKHMQHGKCQARNTRTRGTHESRDNRQPSIDTRGPTHPRPNQKLSVSLSQYNTRLFDSCIPALLSDWVSDLSQICFFNQFD